MSKGKARNVLLNSTIGNVDGNVSGPSWNFVYQNSTVKHPDYNIGDRVALPDGREFTYSKALSACLAGQGAEFTYTGYTAYTAFTVAAAIGASSVTIPAATHAALTTDELRGGYVIIFNGSDNDVQFRGIVGNTAAAANTAFVAYLDGDLTVAVTTSSAAETYKSPYAALRLATSTSLPIAGVPASPGVAANEYFWVQTKGLCWTAPQASVGAAKQQGAFWRHDGSLQDIGTALAVTVAANQKGQYAGHCVQGSAAGNGPLFMLQG